MRVVFMGTPEFSATTLQALIDAGHDIVAVYTQPPRRAGRGKKLLPSPVQKLAESLELPVHSPVNFRAEDDLQRFESHKADIAVVVAYGLIVPQRVLDAPKHGCLNIHASLLPRWRGAAPIQRAIMAGDQETGICIMQMDKGLDTGPVIDCNSLKIMPDDTAGSLHDKLAVLGARMIVEVLKAGNFASTPQPETGATYADKIAKSEARIEWNQPAERLCAHIRGLSPFPGAWCLINDTRIKVLNCEVVEGQGEKGITLNDNLTIACQTGAIRLTRVQKSGKAPASAQDFLRGFAVLKGTLLD